MKRKINVWEHTKTIMDAMNPGVLVTTKADGQVNTMTIGWGTIGIEWGKPICTVFVRQSRFTKAMLDENGMGFLRWSVENPEGLPDWAVSAVNVLADNGLALAALSELTRSDVAELLYQVSLLAADAPGMMILRNR